jgi:flagellar biosynthesis protein FlhB
LSDDQDEKTEQATDARREEYRNRGQVAQTKELGTAVMFLTAAGLIYVLGRFIMQNISEVFEHMMGSSMVATLHSEKIVEMLFYTGIKLVILLAPILLVALVIGVFSQVMQTGFLQVEDALQFDLNKLNPLNAIGRIFSMKGLVEFFKSLIKMIIVFTSIYFLLKSEVKQIPYLSGFSIGQIFSYLGAVIFKLLLGTGIFMLVLAVADYFFQRMSLEKEMMMSKQEIKEEHKSREGDPLIKARIRKIQREVANRKMLTEIPKADVVITNPTHIAVVLKYSDKLPAPQLIAMGADFMAEKIKEIAKQHNIPVIENKPLARTIFKTMKIGQIIPKELFVAVAEVLSYVFRLRKKKIARSRPARSTAKSSMNLNNKRQPGTGV